MKLITEDTYSSCEFCKRYKKTKARPVVCLPLAKKFSDVVAMDLKKFQNVYFIHFIDLFTRYSTAQVIQIKVPQVVVKAFITEWIAMELGAPNRVLVDNGGEFDNEIYIEAMEQYNVEPITTEANSPWSNRICERNHAVIDLVVQQMLEEQPKLELEIALSNAVNAKICLMHYNGFAPAQLATRQLPISICDK